MHLWPSSLRVRLTLWYTALLALPLVVFAFGSYLVFSSALLDRTDRFIGDALTAFARELTAERRSAATIDEALRTTISEVRFRELGIAILDSSHRVVVSSDLAADEPGDADRPPALASTTQIVATLASRELTAPVATSVEVRGAAFRVIARPLALRGESLVIAGAYSLADIIEMLSRIREMFAVGIPLLVLVAALGGYLLARSSLAPMAGMTARAAAIGVSNLHERLPVAGGDEIVALAQVVNSLLDRLEASFEQQRRFMADASHELRTPTAILRAEADVTLSRQHRTEEDYRASVTVMQDAARRLGRIVDDLFLLARADAGHLIVRLAPLYLDEVVHDAVRGVSNVAEARGIRIHLGPAFDAPFDGDTDLLGRLLLNLLDNAIKHSPADSTVEVTMRRDEPHYEIAVTDAGAGIPPEAQGRVFERFFRADVARSREESSATSGAGLGLPIARRIAELHGGTLELVESRAGRTEFRVRLPVASGASPA